MKCNVYGALVIASLFAMTAAHGQTNASTVAFWDFENSTETGMTPTNNQPFNSDAVGNGEHGSADAIASIYMRAWASGSASFENYPGNLYYNDFAAHIHYWDGYVYEGNLMNWAPTNWTIEATIWLGDETGWRTAIGRDGSSLSINDADMYIQRKGDDTGQWRANVLSASEQRLIVDTTNFTYTAGTWIGLAVVSDGATMKIYIDDMDGNGYELEGSGDWTGATAADNALYPSGLNWIFGRGYYGGQADQGDFKIDNVRISDAALTPAEFIPVPLDPFTFTLDPAESTYDQDATISATIVNLDSDYVSSTLYLDGGQVATDSSPSGTGTNVISFAASGLALTNHTAKVVVVGADPAVTVTNEWTFEVVQPPFDSITVIGPTGWSTNDSQTLEVEVVENFSIVDSSSQLYIDDSSVATTVDRANAPTTTIYHAASGLSHGVHTGKVVVVGDPTGGPTTNTWTFSVVLEQAKPTSMLHHWDFEEGSGTTVTDSAGGKNGTIIGTKYHWISGGLALEGGGISGNWNTNTTFGSYVNLPNGLATALPNTFTFEVVYACDIPDNWWQRVWDFGGSTGDNGGEDKSDSGGYYTFLTTYANPGPRADLTDGSVGTLFQVNSSMTSVSGAVNHVVWIYDADEGMSKMYHNGVLEDAAAIEGAWPISSFAGSDVNNWMGRSQWYWDPMFKGQLYDFRIHSGIMTEAEVLTRWEELGGGGATLNPDLDTIIVSGDSATLVWKSESGATYSILSKSSLTAPTWTTKKAGIASAGDGTTSDSVPATNEVEVFQIMGE